MVSEISILNVRFWLFYCILVSADSPDIDGTLLTQRVFRWWLPYSSFGEETMPLNMAFAGSELTALFWGPWSNWSTCIDATQCRTRNQVFQRQRLTQRIRACERLPFKQNAKTRSFYWQTQSEKMLPCVEEKAIEKQYKQCPVIPECVEQIYEGWITFQPCRPLIWGVDTFEDGYAWQELMEKAGQRSGERCEPGVELRIRRCTSNDDGKGCSSSRAINGRIETELNETHCWIDEACASFVSNLEVPLACSFTATLEEPVVKVQWFRRPYGPVPVGYQFRAIPIKFVSPHSRKKPVIQNISLRNSDAWGEKYELEIGDLQRGGVYDFSIGSLDADGNVIFDDSCTATILAGAGDGAWSAWGRWSPCTSQCASLSGIRRRYRRCDSPSPSNKGRWCVGPNSMLLKCVGDDINC